MNEPVISDDLKDKVLECIKLYPTASVRATREKICDYCNAPDRLVRRAIEALRNDGEWVCSDSKQPGYYYSKVDALKTARGLRSRAYKMLKTASMLEKREDGQMGLGI